MIHLISRKIGILYSRSLLELCGFSNRTIKFRFSIMNPKPKILIDTDPGTDDAMALLMVMEAHKRNLVEIVGITTVHGNAPIEKVNINVFRLLELKGLLEIPVFSGATRALVKSFYRPHRPFHGYDGFGDILKTGPPTSMNAMKGEKACLALLRLAEEHKGEIIMVCLGPLTNIALALNICPNWMKLLKDIYLMGGNISGQGNITSTGEFNFVCDPEAAHIVLDRSERPIKIVPWETCLHSVVIPYEERRALGNLNTEAAVLLNTIEEGSFGRSSFKNWVTCDQLAMAWMLHDHTKGCLLNAEQPGRDFVLKSEKHHAIVELSGEHTRGQMFIERKDLKKTSNVLIMHEVDKDLYLDYLRLAFR